MSFVRNLFGGGAAAVSVQEAAQLQGDGEDGALIVDVREPNEFAQARVEGALLLPLGQLNTRFTELPSDRQLLMMCRTGSRSANATRFLNQQGYENAVNVDGGIAAWYNAELPTKTGALEPGEGEL
jgi:rhodanese-related sulfurtransferase